MSLIIAFGFGWVASSLYTQYWAKLKPAVGRALAVVFGKQPAPATASPAGHVAAAPVNDTPNRSPTIGRVLSGFVGFFGWCVKHWQPIACVLVVLFVLSLARGCADQFGLGRSRGEIQRDAARNENTLEARNETTIAGHEEGERFRNDARAIEDELARGNEALESVSRETSALDFMRAWRDADNSLLHAEASAS